MKFISAPFKKNPPRKHKENNLHTKSISVKKDTQK